MTRLALLILFVALAWTALAFPAPAAVPQEVLDAQQERIEVTQRSSEAAIAIFDAAGKGGGSGVIISPDGFALTNFHVVAPCGAAMKCGLNSGEMVDAVVVGIDPVGDVAVIQLLGRDDFPTAELGDSDTVRVGDWVFTAGNPFLLADDFTPSISWGMVSGVRRYQYPAGTLLEYADCIQTDAAINPGNSGGALFDAEGRLVGINGRGSFEKRGRVNVGVGYAISINQIKRFLSHLKSGRIVDHASLGATASTVEISKVVVDDILESSDAYRRGLRYGDTILRIADREITSANEFQKVLATYPRDWTVPLHYRRDGDDFRVRVRLKGVHDPAELTDMVQRQAENPIEPPEGDQPKKDDEVPEGDRPRPPQLPGFARRKPEVPAEIADRYELRRGYANYWYNSRRQEQLFNQYRGTSGLEEVGYHWQIEGTVDGHSPFQLRLDKEVGSIRLPIGNSGALYTESLDNQLSPPGSGGLLVALHLWQRLLDRGLDRFGEVYYLGQLPFGDDGHLADCLVGLYAGLETRFLFDPESGDLVGFELFTSDHADPCEVHFSNFREHQGRRLPHHWHVQHGDTDFARLEIDTWQFTATTEDNTNEEN